MLLFVFDRWDVAEALVWWAALYQPMYSTTASSSWLPGKDLKPTCGDLVRIDVWYTSGGRRTTV
jgi:hypothetical protein